MLRRAGRGGDHNAWWDRVDLARVAEEHARTKDHQHALRQYQATCTLRHHRRVALVRRGQRIHGRLAKLGLGAMACGLCVPCRNN